MLSHVYVGTSDFDADFPLYGAMMAALGNELKRYDPAYPWAIWMEPGKPRPLFILGRTFDGKPASAGNGQMVAFEASTRSIVDECYRLALLNGGVCEGPPGMRPEYHADYYGAYFRDPSGNKLCVCSHHPE